MRVLALAFVVLAMLLASSEAAFKLKKLAGAALLGAAIAPRFVPVPIPHHVYHKEDHGWHGHGHHDHGHYDHGHHDYGHHGHGHKELFSFHKGGWQHYGGIHDASAAGGHGGHGWW